MYHPYVQKYRRNGHHRKFQTKIKQVTAKITFHSHCWTKRLKQACPARKAGCSNLIKTSFMIFLENL